eukprot:750574-Hanusia_phi.AAC.3
MLHPYPQHPTNTLFPACSCNTAAVPRLLCPVQSFCSYSQTKRHRKLSLACYMTSSLRQLTPPCMAWSGQLSLAPVSVASQPTALGSPRVRALPADPHKAARADFLITWLMADAMLGRQAMKRTRHACRPCKDSRLKCDNVQPCTR